MIRENDRVMVGNPIFGSPKKGTVVEVYEVCGSPVVVVQLDNSKEKVKCLADDVRIIHEQEDDPDTITISKEELVKALARATCPDEMMEASPEVRVMLPLFGIIFSRNLIKELFQEKESDD